MVETIKKYALAAGGGIVAVILAVIYYLLGKNTELKNQVASLKAGDLQKEEEDKYDNEKRVATDSEKEYDRIRDQWLNRSSDGSTDEH